MPGICVPWGDGELALTLPESWTLHQVASSHLRPAGPQWPERVAGAIAQPVAGLSLEKLLAARRGGRVVIVVEDLTRHSPLDQILPIILREIDHAGFPRERIEVFFATGMHPPLDAGQACEKLGPEASKLAWRCNPWHEENSFVSVGSVGGMDVRIDSGVAGADLRIIVSSVSPHLQAGFGGGYKMLLPGAASRQTIMQLHRLGLGRSFGQLVGSDGESNVMRRAIDKAGAMIDANCGASFAVQYLLDEADLPTSVAAGEPLPTQRMIAKQCAVACGVLVNEPADVLVTNAHPRDYDLWQSFKSIPNTLWAARPNGVVICLARCEALSEGMKIPRIPLSMKWVRRILHWFGPGVLPSVLMRAVPSLPGDAGFFVRLAAGALHRNWILMVSPALHKAGVQFPGLPIFANVDDAFKAAAQLLGAGPQKVVVFPSGGAVYPVPGNRGKP